MIGPFGCSPQSKQVRPDERRLFPCSVSNDFIIASKGRIRVFCKTYGFIEQGLGCHDEFLGIILLWTGDEYAHTEFADWDVNMHRKDNTIIFRVDGNRCEAPVGAMVFINEGKPKIVAENCGLLLVEDEAVLKAFIEHLISRGIIDMM